MQEINVEISNDIYKYQHPKPMHWSGIHWLIHLWIGQAKSWSTAGGVKWHSWNRTVGQCRHFPCHEISWCCRRLLHSQLLFPCFFSFWNTLQLLCRSTQSPSDTYLCMCHKEFLFLAQPGQAGSDKSCFSYRDALCSKHAARNSQINGDLKSLSRMLQGITKIKIINSRNNNY